MKFLTEPGDLVLDIFAGSNTTGRAAEDLERRWVAIEVDGDYVAGSALRFMRDLQPCQVRENFERLRKGESLDFSGVPLLWETGTHATRDG